MQGFIEEVVRSGGVCKRDQVMNLYQTNPDLERYSDWSASWKTRRFKDIAAGMGCQVYLGLTGNRWQQKVNGEMKDFYDWFDHFNTMHLRPKRVLLVSRPMPRRQQQKSHLC